MQYANCFHIKHKVLCHKLKYITITLSYIEFCVKSYGFTIPSNRGKTSSNPHVLLKYNSRVSFKSKKNAGKSLKNYYEFLNACRDEFPIIETILNGYKGSLIVPEWLGMVQNDAEWWDMLQKSNGEKCWRIVGNGEEWWGTVLNGVEW